MSTARQYETDQNLRIRIQTHEQFTQGALLEPAVDAAVALHPLEDLLDVGTGTGEYPNRLSRRNLRVGSVHRGRLVGIDSSEAMIAKAQSAHTDVEFRVADVHQLPFREGSFDVVTARHMLHHVSDVAAALKEIHRVLRPGGRLIAVTNTRDSMAVFWDLVAKAAGRTCFAPLLSQHGSEPFSEISGAQALRGTFGNVETIDVNAALVFPAAEPAVRYLDSCRTMCQVTDQEWQALLTRFAAEVQSLTSTGPWRVPKRAAILRAWKR